MWNFLHRHTGAGWSVFLINRVVYSLYFPLVSSKFPRIFFQVSAFLIDLIVNSAFFSQVSSKFPRIFFQISPRFPNSLFYWSNTKSLFLPLHPFQVPYPPSFPPSHLCNAISWYEKGRKIWNFFYNKLRLNIPKSGAKQWRRPGFSPDEPMLTIRPSPTIFLGRQPQILESFKEVASFLRFFSQNCVKIWDFCFLRSSRKYKCHIFVFKLTILIKL